MTILNREEVNHLLKEEAMPGEVERKLDPDDQIFQIKASEIQEIHRHVRMAGGSQEVRDKVLKILANVVERTGSTTHE